MLLKLLLLILFFANACSSLPKENIKVGEPVLPPIILHVYPESCIIPCTIRIRWRIEPHADNRNFSIILWEGTGFAGDRIKISEHSQSLAGDLDRAVFPEIFMEMSTPGDYLVEVVVIRASTDENENLRVSKIVRVVGGIG